MLSFTADNVQKSSKHNCNQPGVCKSVNGILLKREAVYTMFGGTVCLICICKLLDILLHVANSHLI